MRLTAYNGAFSSSVSFPTTFCEYRLGPGVSVSPEAEGPPLRGQLLLLSLLVVRRSLVYSLPCTCHPLSLLSSSGGAACDGSSCDACDGCGGGGSIAGGGDTADGTSDAGGGGTRRCSGEECSD